MDGYWRDKAAVVTGAARGQGAAEVLRLLSAGARVYATDILTADDPAWTDLRHAAAANLNRLVPIQSDVSASTDWNSLRDRIGAEGSALYGLVNNAGITLRKTVTQTSPEEWDRLIGVNLDGPFLGIRTLAPIMERGGSIVNISSVGGLTGYFSAAYCTSKWGLLGLTKAASLELAERGIRVNAICPGLVETPMIHGPNAVMDASGAKRFWEANRDATPMARGADPDEIAAAVMFLLGPEASFITGIELPVDGGMTGGGIYWRVGKAVGIL